MFLALEGDAPTRVFSGQQIRRSRLFFLSSAPDLAEWVPTNPQEANVCLERDSENEMIEFVSIASLSLFLQNFT